MHPLSELEKVENYICSNLSKDVKKTVREYFGGRVTSWTTGQFESQPGFFTPYDSSKKMGVKEAVMATIGTPLVCFSNAFLFAIIVPTFCFIRAIVNLSLCNLIDFLDDIVGVVVCPLMSIKFALEGVIALLKEITALITRTVATLSVLCKNLGKTDSTHQDTRNEDNWMYEDNFSIIRL